MANAALVSVKEMQEGLGRLVFVAGPLTYAKPFLGPLFAWVAACPLGMMASPPAIVRLVLWWFAAMATDFPWRPCKVGRESLGEMFRVDAKAEGADVVVLGGWTTQGGAQTGQARWFSHRVTREEAPWAFAKGDPQRAIAALELLAVLFGVLLLIPAEPGACKRKGSIEFSVGTDNQSNAQLTRKWITTKLPLALVAMELAAQLAKRNLELDLKWRRRDLNVEADALTNGKFEGFAGGLRADASRVADTFICLPQLSRAWESSRTGESMNLKRAPRGDKRKLRERDPW